MSLGSLRWFIAIYVSVTLELFLFRGSTTSESKTCKKAVNQLQEHRDNKMKQYPHKVNYFFT